MKDQYLASSLTCGMSLLSESSLTVHSSPVTPFSTIAANSPLLPEPQRQSKLLERKLSITLEEPDKGSTHSVSTCSGSSAAVDDAPTAMDNISMCCNDHEELGSIRYLCTSLTDAQQHAEKLQKPIFCIESDVPGDTSCGSEVLSHPLIVEAAESFFVSTVLINPPLNFDDSISSTSRCIKRSRTRLRILDATGREISNCAVDGNDVMSVATVVEAIISGLELYKIETPRYLQLLQEEEIGKWCRQLAVAGVQKRVDRQAIFGVSDAAIGEVEFAVLYGVLAVKAGQIEHQKVVQVTYDSSRLCYCNLVRHALKRNVADVIYSQNHEERMGARMEAVGAEANPTIVEYPGSMQPSHDPKHYLRRTMLRFVPLTDLQAMRANHLVHNGVFNEAMRLLSPRQGFILMQVIRNGNRRHLRETVDVPIACAWKSVSSVLQSP